MKNTIKMILALSLALCMICALGTVAFADNMPTVTKNPGNESHYAGETATFIADASSYDGIEWFFLAPNGTEYDLNSFKALFPACTVMGQGTTTLRIANLQTGMNGWEVYCCFTLGSNYVATTVATISVYVPSAPTYTAPTYTAPVTTYVTDPMYVYEYVCDPIYVYDEPDYVDLGSAMVYADGTIDFDEYEPDCVQIGGQLYCSDGTIRPGNSNTDYVWSNNVRLYSDGTIVY